MRSGHVHVLVFPLRVFLNFFISSATWKFLLLRCVAFVLLNSLSFTIFKVPFEIFFLHYLKIGGFCPVLKSALVNLNKLCLLVLLTICTEKRSSDSLIFVFVFSNLATSLQSHTLIYVA